MGVFEPGFVVGFDADQVGKAMKNAMSEWSSSGYCIIIDPSKKIVSQNIMTGQAFALQIPVGSGPMRMQQLRPPATGAVTAHEKSNGVRFSMDYPRDQRIPEIRPGFEVVVTNGGNDPYANKFQYVVSSALNSSVAWQRVIQCVANSRSKPEYQWSFLTGSVSGPAGVLADVFVDVSYLDAKGVWQPYDRQMFTGSYRLACFLGTQYQLTFSKQGYTSQTISPITPELFADTPINSVMLV